MNAITPALHLFVGLVTLLTGLSGAAQTPPAPKTDVTARPTTPASDFLIVPGVRVGPVRATTSEAALVKLLGRSVVTVADTLYGPEGDALIGTTLYKGTADEVQIFYGDEEKRTRPAAVIVRPKPYNDDGDPIQFPAPTRWATADGLRIGMTLKELERRNGKPFALWGFAWDYGGEITDWKGGKLDQTNPKLSVGITLGAPAVRTAAQEKAYDTVQGDTKFVSSGAAMQLLNPVITKLSVGF